MKINNSINVPWDYYIEHIKIIEIYNGITSISSTILSNLNSLDSTWIPESLINIEDSAFSHGSKFELPI